MMSITAFASSTSILQSIIGGSSPALRTTSFRPNRRSLLVLSRQGRTYTPLTARSPPRASTNAPNDGKSMTGLGSPDFVERIRAATALATSDVTANVEGTPERVKALLPVAQSDSHSQVRFVALSALAAQPADAMSSELLSEVLVVCRKVLSGDQEPSCRCGAADVIAALRLNDGFDDLVAAYSSENADWMLRLSIVAGLGEMQNEKSFDMLASVVKPDGELYDYAKSEPLVLAAAVGALGDLGDMRALPIVSSLAKEGEDEAVRERATIAVQMLEKSVSL